MKNRGIRRAALQVHLLRSVGLVALSGMMLPAQSGAQTVTTDDDKGSESDIVVTGTRVVRDGYSAPTPTTVLGAEELAARAPNNVADFVNQLPSLSASQTPRTNTGQISNGLSGMNTLNLRNLTVGFNGGSRTLVLLDGQRVGASALNGAVDINTFPEQLIKRVDIVTGGASAEWGSDAIAGVVNFVLDREFTGIKGDVQGGVTTYGDDGSYKASLALGSRFADGRGHILISGELAHNDGIRYTPRPWASKADQTLLFPNPTYTPTNGQPQFLVRAGAGFATATPGGIITSGPLRGTYFGLGGTPLQFNYGPVVSGNFMQGGQSAYTNFSDTGDIDPEVSRRNIFARIGYDVTDHVTIFAQGSFARATTSQNTLNQFNFGHIAVATDNAFIPAVTRAAITAYNLANPATPIRSLTLGSLNQDLGSIPTYAKRESRRFVVGARGDFSALGTDWTWDAYVQQTTNQILTSARLSITANYRAAIDSVVNPATGAIICRSTLGNPANGCVPYNIFGTGVNSASAIDYVLGSPWGRTKLRQTVEAATLHGNPLATWVGPVSVAFGIEHRRESVSGSADPLSATNSYFAGNYKPTFGAYTVTEGFAEAVVPLAKDMAFAKSLDVSAALRVTDYSTSGRVETWKLGATYKPIDDIGFRITRSRDIRAPNLAELYQAGQVVTTSVVNEAGTAFTILQITSGNLDLNPEVADTLGLGVVLRPTVLPGLQASVDYYRISIADAITTLTAQQVVTACERGNTGLCPQIVRNAAGAITQVNVRPGNFASQIARGIDFEASYRGIREPLFRGNVTIRALATRFLENRLNNGLTESDNVGTNSQNGSALLSLPKWRYLASIAWERDALSLTATGRGLSAGVYNTNYIACTSACPNTSGTLRSTIERNDIPGAFYVDGSASYKLPMGAEMYLAVDNIANRAPPMVAFGPSIGIAPLSVNYALYDVLGRTFRAGVRFKF